MSRLLSALALIGLLAVVGASSAQEDLDDPLAQLERRKNDKAVGSDGAVVADGKPFAATLSIESSMPISYGDDIVIAVQILPQQGIDLQHVRIHPKGQLRSLYGTPQADGKTEPSPGIECPVGTKNRIGGRSFIVTCRLSGNDKWFDWNAMLEAKQFQIEIEIALQEQGDLSAAYYENITAEFVSPKAHVILGGFFGAVLWALFLRLSTEPAQVVSGPVQGWRDIWGRAQVNLPNWVAKFGSGTSEVLRRALVGGFTALVLIVVAKGTEGFEPPISIRIQDFWGGMMIGIVSTPLAKWLRDKLAAI